MPPQNIDNPVPGFLPPRLNQFFDHSNKFMVRQCSRHLARDDKNPLSVFYN
jgi:hypothetical protein